MSKDSQQWISTLKRLAGRQLDEAREMIEIVCGEKNFRQVGLIVHRSARAALERGMIAYRVDRSVEDAIMFFQKGVEIVAELVKVIARIRDAHISSRFEASGFEEPMYVCLLANRFDMALLLANAIVQPEVRKATDVSDDIRTCILAATIRSDRAEFAKQRQTYDGLPEPEKNLATYVLICEKIMSGDLRGYHDAIALAEQQFAQRAHMKGMATAPVVYGGPDHNDVVFDFMAVGLAKLARARGLSTSLNSVYVPAEVVAAGMGKGGSCA